MGNVRPQTFVSFTSIDHHLHQLYSAKSEAVSFPNLSFYNFGVRSLTIYSSLFSESIKADFSQLDLFDFTMTC